jgi:hypothetical protein
MFLMPLVHAYKVIAKESFIGPTHAAFVVPFVVVTVFLLYLTRYIWGHLGFHFGYFFPLLIAVVHLTFAVAPSANGANKAQSLGVVCGVIVYGVSRFF